MENFHLLTLLGDNITKIKEEKMGGLGLPELIIMGIIGILVILPFWKIFTKAGFSGWISLVMIFPFINILGLFYLAFAEWPIHRGLNK